MTDLRALDAAATQGEWEDHPYASIRVMKEGSKIPIARYENLAFVIALVNAYRSGRLVESSALAQARDKGAKEMRERCAAYHDRHADGYAKTRAQIDEANHRTHAAAIHALTPDATEGDT